MWASWFSKPIRLGRQSGQYDAEIDQKYRKNVNPCTLTPLMESANILRSADILSAVGGGTFCHPSSAKRLDGQHVRHPAARRMHALRQAESLKALG
jgi:hypothetical protein